VCGSAKIKEQVSYIHMFERDRIASLDMNNYSTLSNEHNWEELCIQLRDH
jgi:hypothetical protein